MSKIVSFFFDCDKHIHVERTWGNLDLLQQLDDENHFLCMVQYIALTYHVCQLKKKMFYLNLSLNFNAEIPLNPSS